MFVYISDLLNKCCMSNTNLSLFKLARLLILRVTAFHPNALKSKDTHHALGACPWCTQVSDTQHALGNHALGVLCYPALGALGNHALDALCYHALTTLS